MIRTASGATAKAVVVKGLSGSADQVEVGVNVSQGVFTQTHKFEPGEARAFAALLVDAANQADRNRDLEKHRQIQGMTGQSPAPTSAFNWHTNSTFKAGDYIDRNHATTHGIIDRQLSFAGRDIAVTKAGQYMEYEPARLAWKVLPGDPRMPKVTGSPWADRVTATATAL